MADRQDSADKSKAVPAQGIRREEPVHRKEKGAAPGALPSTLPDETVGSTIDRIGGPSPGANAGQRPTTGNIGDAWAGPVMTGNLGDDGVLGNEGNIDTSADMPIGIPGIGNLDPAGTGNAGNTGLGNPDTALDEAIDSSASTDVPISGPRKP